MDDNLRLESVEIPSFFICPVSLQIMKDPVTISTGMTFDRESIQKWLYSYNHITCPITKEPLSDFSLTPNSNLLRLIQSWQVKVNPSSTKSIKQQQQQPEHDASTPLSVVLEEMKQPHLQVKSLRKIKTFICNRTFFTGDDVLYSSVASLLVKSKSNFVGHDQSSTLIDEAVSVLCLLRPSDETIKLVYQNETGRLIDSLCAIMTKHSHNQTRTQAAVLLKSIYKVADAIYKERINAESFYSITEILKDQNSKQGSMAVLTILTEVLPYGKNKEKAIKGGMVPVIVELLAEKNERRACEMMLNVLEKLCRKAEGRAEVIAHPIGLAAVISKILSVSGVGNYKAISLLLMILRFCKSNEVAEEFIEVGGVARVFKLLQSGCDTKTQEKAWEILGFHKKTWSKSPCYPSPTRSD